MKRHTHSIKTALWEWIEEYAKVTQTQTEPHSGQRARIEECKEEINKCIEELLEAE